MAAFDFPSPPVEDGFEVKNELTGITYKYDAASGSWVVVASNVQDNYYTKPEVDDLLQSVSPDLIWENKKPPLPDTPYKLWYNTDTLELYFYYCDPNGVCAWTPTSVPLTALEVITTELDTTNAMVASVERLASANFSELQQIQANLGQVTLQEVLDNGNVANKDIVLTDGVDDLIDISPTEGRIIIASDVDLKTPKLTLAHFGDIDESNSKAEIELDENGTRLDFEMSGEVKDVHFRFGDAEKFIINHEGDAEFIGKIRVQPGTETNEVVTFGQLATLEEEIEQLAPTLERGTWNFTTDSFPGTGEYTLIKQFLDEDEQEALCQATFAECMRAAADDAEAGKACSRALANCQNAIDGSAVVTTNVWSEAESIVFNEVDANGILHNFGGIDSDHLLDVFNEGDSGYMVGDILTHGGGNFQFDLVTSVGVAAGLASIKIFKVEGAVDLTNYIRKGTEESTYTEDLHNTRLNFKGDGYLTFRDNTYLEVYDSENKVSTKIDSEGLYSASEEPTSGYAPIWVPNITEIKKRFASKTEMGLRSKTNLKLGMSLKDSDINGQSKSGGDNIYLWQWYTSIKIKWDPDKMRWSGPDITSAGIVPCSGIVEIWSTDGKTLIYKAAISSVEYITSDFNHYMLNTTNEEWLFVNRSLNYSSDAGDVDVCFYTT